MNINEARAVITGGASGLGNAVARHIVAAGGKVALLDVQDALGASAAAALGSAATFIKCDVTNEQSVNDAAQRAHAFLGSINLTVNCAGVVGAGRMLGKSGPMAGEFFTKVVHINLIGTFLVDKACANLMTQNAPNADGERGLIVHTSSVAAFEGQIGQVAYSATKGAVLAMTLPMARELAAFGIRVLTIAPGVFLWLHVSLPRRTEQGLGLSGRNRWLETGVVGRAFRRGATALAVSARSGGFSVGARVPGAEQGFLPARRMD